MLNLALVFVLVFLVLLWHCYRLAWKWWGLVCVLLVRLFVCLSCMRCVCLFFLPLGDWGCLWHVIVSLPGHLFVFIFKP